MVKKKTKSTLSKNRESIHKKADQRRKEAKKKADKICKAADGAARKCKTAKKKLRTATTAASKAKSAKIKNESILKRKKLRQKLKKLHEAKKKKVIKKAKKHVPKIPFAEMVLLLRKKKVPTMVQHCILKVYPKMHGNQLQRFHKAYNICVAVFQKHGYMFESSPTKMTGKGVSRNRKHQRETISGRKSRLFDAVIDKIFGVIFQKLDEKEGKK
jgi:hypothetical protein